MVSIICIYLFLSPDKMKIWPWNPIEIFDKILYQFIFDMAKQKIDNLNPGMKFILN